MSTHATKLSLNKETPGHGGPCGFRVWDKEANEYCSEAYLIDTAGCLYEIGILADRSTLFFSKQERYVIEMSSGFKCEDGKSVYAGDVVCVPTMLGEPVNDAWSSMVGVVKFVNCAWVVGDKHGCTQLRAYDKIQLIGNIHQLDKLPKKYRGRISKTTYME